MDSTYIFSSPYNSRIRNRKYVYQEDEETKSTHTRRMKYCSEIHLHIEDKEVEIHMKSIYQEYEEVESTCTRSMKKWKVYIYTRSIKK